MAGIDPDRWRRMQPVLDRALELPADRRRAWLDDVCAGDQQLRADIEAILAADEEAGGALRSPTSAFIDSFVEEAQQSTLTTPRKAAPALDVGQITRRILARRLRALEPCRGAANLTDRFLPGVLLTSRYRIVALLGRGGMGEVYRADDLKLGQSVALKFLPPALEKDPTHLDRLLEEVRLARQVAHPNVCRVYDIGEAEGRHFSTMEYVDGEDLAGLLRRIGRLPREKALDIARQLCAGLRAAHELGILHRDLKPANVMLDGRGRARITDFGLAVAADAVHGKDARAGTPAYMAPEQLEGKEATARSDIYALGLVLYELFTGKRAFEASSAEELGRLHLESTPINPSRHVAALDPAIERAILRCLEKNQARRPPSVAHVLAMLPGGDPLAAALAAGETPSPEMVAAAGEEAELRPAVAFGLLAAAIVGVLAAVALAARSPRLDQVPLTRSPEVLRERAREILSALGHDVPPRDDAWWFGLDEGYADRKLSGGETPPLAEAWPSPVRFYYRLSPRPMVPLTPSFVSRTNPAPFWSGEAYVSLDPRGRLLELAVLVPQVEPAGGVQTSLPDWRSILALASADTGTLREVEPLWTPDVASDSRAAWEGTDRGAPVRIEAAAWRGRPVWMRTIAPWERAEREATARPLRDPAPVVFVITLVITLIVLGVLARRNLRLGRGDSRGALRVAVSVFVCFSISAALRYRWTLDAGELNVFLLLWIGSSLFNTLEAWLYYLGIEPFLRRHWPHRLIAWTRLVEGRVADPLVGRELLLGVLAGAGTILVWFGVRGTESLPLEVRLGSAREFWAFVVSSSASGVMQALGGFAVLLVLRLLLRREVAAWAALLAVGTLFFLPPGDPLVTWVTAVLMATVLFLAMRVGLVASATAFVVVGLMANLPLTLDMTRWYAWRTAVVAAAVLLLALWGFRAVMRGRRILPAEVLEV